MRIVVTNRAGEKFCKFVEALEGVILNNSEWFYVHGLRIVLEVVFPGSYDVELVVILPGRTPKCEKVVRIEELSLPPKVKSQVRQCLLLNVSKGKDEHDDSCCERSCSQCAQSPIKRVPASWENLLQGGIVPGRAIGFA